MRFRLFDLMLLVTASGLAFGLVASFTPGNTETALLCLLGLVAAPLFLLIRPRIGTVRCPYCDRRAVRPRSDGSPVVCEECGSRIEWTGPGAFHVVSSPSDERVWIGRVMPKLSGLRRELRPGPAQSARDDEGSGGEK